MSAALVRWMWTSVCLGGLAAAGLAQPPPDEPPPGAPPEPAGPGPAAEVRTVRVTAEGYNREDALKQALRRALEEGAGVEISSHSEARDFALIRDTIYSRAAGIVQEYRVLSERGGEGGTVIVEVEARVRPDAIARQWGEVQNLLDQVGRPRIMVWIDERIDGALQRDSVVEARIEELFVKAGFDLVTRKSVGEAPIPEAADVRTGTAPTRLQEAARAAGAHLLVRGSANADRAGLENIYGSPAAFYNCDVQARIYGTDTGRVLASESIPVTRRGARARREFSPQAAREALVQATFPASDNPARAPALAERLYESVMQHWATQLTAGGDLELEVRPLSFRAYVNLKRALGGIEGVTSVEGDYGDGGARLRLKSHVAAATLAELLSDKPFDAWLEVVDLKLNRIRARGLAPAAESQPSP